MELLRVLTSLQLSAAQEIRSLLTQVVQYRVHKIIAGSYRGSR
jgi:hypothetical protein